MAAFAVNNASYTVAEQTPNVMNSGAASIKKIKNYNAPKEEPDQTNRSSITKSVQNFSVTDYLAFCDLLKINNELEESKLDFNHLYGVLLQVGSGKITIERAEEITKINVVKLKNRIKHLKKKQKSKNKYENKKITNRRLIEAAFLEGWIILEKKIGADIKKLNKKGKQKITIQFLQTEYMGAATNWFSGKYGLEKTPETRNKNNNLK